MTKRAIKAEKLLAKILTKKYVTCTKDQVFSIIFCAQSLIENMSNDGASCDEIAERLAIRNRLVLK